MKDIVCTIVGCLGAGFACLFGGWDAGMTTLVIFMIIDYLTGIVVAAVFHRSSKSDTGALQSKAGWKGLAKKCVTLLFVIIGNRLDIIIGTTYIRDAIVIAFCANELLSIIENAGLMGIPVPKALVKAIDILKQKSGEDDSAEGKGEDSD